jgi:hypothetical protein
MAKIPTANTAIVGLSMGFSFLIDSEASFAASKESRYGSIRGKLFGKPLQHKGIRVKSSVSDGGPAMHADQRPTQLSRRKPNKSGPKKSTASAVRPHDEHYVSELVRRRHPIEYLGFLITNEQQPDGNWVASFVRTGDQADCAHRSAAYVASYMAFTDAKRQIDAAVSGPASNRKFERVLVALDGAIFANGVTQECQILDLSAGGARLQRDNPIALTGELFLYIKGFGRFRAEVVRSNNTELAVRFVPNNEATMGVLKGLSNYVKGLDTPATKMRKEARIPTSIAAVCRMANGAAVPCEIIDASMNSMSLRISERPRIGSLIKLGGTKVRVVRHHAQGIAVQCLPPPSPKSGRYVFKED